MHILTACCLSFSLLRSTASPAPAWHNLGPGGGGWITSICASPHDLNGLFAGCDIGGFYRSTDGGKSYQICNTGLRGYCPERIVPHPRDPNVIYLGGQSGVHKSTNSGLTWQWLREGFPPKTYPLPKALALEVDAALIQALRPLHDVKALGLLLARFTGLRSGELTHLELNCVTQDANGRYSLRVPIG